MVTTDGFTVQPLEFPGGNIGSLAVHGTVNDLAVAGRTTLPDLERISGRRLGDRAAAPRMQALASAARDSGVAVVAGDTKVVGRGECDGIYLATTGVGFRPRRLDLGLAQIRAGDRILVSGPSASMARPSCSPVKIRSARRPAIGRGERAAQAQALMTVPELRFMRDPTRGGLATVAHEIARATGLTSACPKHTYPSMTRFNRCVNCSVSIPCIWPAKDASWRWSGSDAAAALAALRPVAPQATLIGEIAEGVRQVVFATSFGGERVLDELEDDPLPRIC